MDIQKQKKIYRLPPCADYDIEGMQSWLEDMAQKGWLLAEDGFHFGVAVFESHSPVKARYRLIAVPKESSIWQDSNMGDPDGEEKELYAHYGWEYMGRRGRFYIYRSLDFDAREPNTDLAIQALTLKSIQKEAISAGLTFLFCCVFNIIISRCFSTFWNLVIDLRTWFVLLSLFLILTTLLQSIRKILHLRRLRLKLQSGESFAHIASDKKKQVLYFTKRSLSIFLFGFWSCSLISSWFSDVSYENRIALEGRLPEVPFATMADLTEEDITQLRFEPLLIGKSFNTYETWTDWLAPVNYSWHENGTFYLNGKSVLDGGLTITYHETIHPVIARELAQGYYDLDKRQNKKHFSEINGCTLNADSYYCYSGIFPSLIVQKGNQILKATFYQNGEQDHLSYQEWAEIMAESLN